MYIFELVKPGVFLKCEDRAQASNFQWLLSCLEGAFFDANVSLNLFEAERNTDFSHDDSSFEQWQRDTQKKKELEMQIRSERGLSPYTHYDEVNFEVEILFKKEKWKNGEVPKTHQRRKIFLHAKSFLYSLDTIDKFLKVISEEQSAPQVIKDLHARIGNDFPHLRGVRNSAQHLEDRARGLGAGRVPKPLDLQPVDNGFFNVPYRALMLNNLFGTKFGSTMADGHYGEVDISPESLVKMQSIIQQTFDSFEWDGPKVHLP